MFQVDDSLCRRLKKSDILGNLASLPEETRKRKSGRALIGNLLRGILGAQFDDPREAVRIEKAQDAVGRRHQG